MVKQIDWGFGMNRDAEEEDAPAPAKGFTTYASGAQPSRPTFNYLQDGNPTQVFSPGQDINKQIQGILGFGSNYTDWIANTEEKRGQEKEDILRNASAAFDKPSMTDADISKQFGQAAGTSARDFNANMHNLRTGLGGAGITGGGRAQGQAIGYEAARQAVLTNTRASLYARRVETDMLDRAAKFQAEMAVANQVGRDPSVAPMDWLGTAGSTILDKYGIDKTAENAKRLAKSQESNGLLSILGDVAGAVIPGGGIIKKLFG